MYGFWGFSSSFIMFDQKIWRHERYTPQSNFLIFYKRSLLSCFSISFSLISLLLNILKEFHFDLLSPVTFSSINPSTARVKWSQYWKSFLILQLVLVISHEKINNLIVFGFASSRSFEEEFRRGFRGDVLMFWHHQLPGF